MRHLFLAIASVFSLAFLSACDNHDDLHNHDESAEVRDLHDHENETSTVRIDEEHGLELSEEIVNALEVKTQKIEIRDLNVQIILSGQVIVNVPRTRVNVKVPPERFEALKSFSAKHGKLIIADSLPGKVSGLADLVYELGESQNAALGEFVNIELQQHRNTVLTIPESAVLETINGEYVYVASGESFRRVKVKTSVGSEGLLEILEGVKDGESVVVSPVVQLWLIELKLTKGGGHSH